MTNIFMLLGRDDPEQLEKATNDIKTACDESIKQIQAAMKRQEKYGAIDSDSRNAIVEYLWQGIRWNGEAPYPLDLPNGDYTYRVHRS